MMNSSKKHISGKFLTKYAIHLEDPNNPDYDGSRLSQRQIIQIKEHLKECDLCSNRVLSAIQEFHSLVEQVEDAGFGNVSTHGKEAANFRIDRALNWLRILRQPKIQIAAGLALGLIIILNFYIANRDLYVQLALISKPTVEFEVRAGLPDLLIRALTSYRNDQYEQAAVLFEEFIEKHTNKEFHYFAHYYAGVSYLLLSEKRILRLVYAFDEDQVRNGILHLQEVEKLTTNTRYLEEEHWYLAKAYLMLRDRQFALDELNKVLQYHGTRSREAKSLWKKLSRMEKR